MAAPLLALAPWMIAGGTLLSAYGQYQAGNRALANSKIEAADLRRQGKERFAIASHEVARRYREGELLASKAKAAGASSGAGGYEDVIADIEARAEYNALSALHEGQMDMFEANRQADSVLRQGYEAKNASRYNVLSTLLSGGGAALGRYG